MFSVITSILRAYQTASHWRFSRSSCTHHLVSNSSSHLPVNPSVLTRLTLPNMIGLRTVCPGLGLNTMPPLWRERMGVDDRTGVRQISMAQEESLQCERAHPTLWEWSRNLWESEIHIVSNTGGNIFCLLTHKLTSINKQSRKQLLQVQTGQVPPYHHLTLPALPSSPCINSTISNRERKHWNWHLSSLYSFDRNRKYRCD